MQLERVTKKYQTMHLCLKYTMGNNIFLTCYCSNRSYITIFFTEQSQKDLNVSPMPKDSLKQGFSSETVCYLLSNFSSLAHDLLPLYNRVG